MPVTQARRSPAASGRARSKAVPPLWGRAGRGSTFEAAKIPSAGVGGYPGGFARQDGPFERTPSPTLPHEGRDLNQRHCRKGGGRENGVMRWLTFDCYGTLVDWRTGIAGAIKAVAPGESERLLPMYYRHEFQVQAEGFRP